MRYGVCVAGVLTVGLWSTDANARPEGEPQPCGNCHYQTDGPTIDVAFSNDNPDVGETVTITVSLTANNAEALRTGMWMTTPDQGAFGLVDPDTTRFDAPDSTTGVLHSEPRDLDGQNSAQFQFEWTAPASPGVADFTIFSVTGNTNGTSDDDHHASFVTQVAHGCEGTMYYVDGDGDGYGDDESGTLSCDVVADRVTQGGDCNDGDADAYPGAAEICNTADDDCDGELDNGLEPGLYYPDPDGDGYASASATPEFTCNDAEGVTSELGDCEPLDPDIYPGAPERPNGVDDDCDGEVDEDAEDPASTGGEDDDGGDTDAGPPDDTAGADAAGDDGSCQVAPERAVPLSLLLLLPLVAASSRKRSQTPGRR